MSLRERRRTDHQQQQPAAGAANGVSPSHAYSGYGGYGAGFSSPHQAAAAAAASPQYAQQQPPHQQPHAAQSPYGQQQAQYGGYPHSTRVGAGLGVSSGGGSDYGGAYGGYSEAASGDETKNGRKNKNSKRRPQPGSTAGTSMWWQITIVFVITTFMLFGATLHYRSRYTHAKKHHDHAITHHERNLQSHATAKTRAEAELKGKKEQIQFLEDRVADLTKQHTDVKTELADRVSNQNSIEERARKREDVLRGRMMHMQDRIARESHRATLERFGPGPHQVEFQVELPADPNNYATIPANPTILINLYTDDMPHAAHLFLEQIAHGLWNGCSFVVNAAHVFQVGAVRKESGESQMKYFAHKELDILAFQEYSPDHPHEQYTVGFAGRPAGPEFYINKMDNTESNGPGGQDHHDLNEEADPCFGKVDDSSITVLERLFGLPVVEENGPNDQFLVEPLHILSARIIGWVDPVEVTLAQKRQEEAVKEAAAKEANNDNAAEQQQHQQQEQQQQQTVTPDHDAEEKKKMHDAIKKAEAASPVKVDGAEEDDKKP